MKPIQWTQTGKEPQVMVERDRWGDLVKNGTTFELDREFIQSQGLTNQQISLTSEYMFEYKRGGRKAEAFILDDNCVAMYVDGNMVFKIKPEGDVDY